MLLSKKASHCKLEYFFFKIPVPPNTKVTEFPLDLSCLKKTPQSFNYHANVITNGDLNVK